MSPEQAATVTPGQAAYEELVRRVGSEYDSWEKLPGDLRAAHEAAARAAIEAAPPAIVKFDGKLTEADVAELREKFAEAARTGRPSVLVEPSSERVAELVTEGNDLRALAAEIIDGYDAATACDRTPEDEAQLEDWRQRAGLEAVRA